MHKRCVTLLLAMSLLAGCSALAAPDGEAPPTDRELASLTAPVQEPEPTVLPFYPDVREGTWYYPYIHALCELRVLPGGEHFGPAEDETRLEFVLGLYRLHMALDGAPADGSSSPFADIPAGTEASEAVEWARRSGVTQGVSAAAFGPDDPLVREQGCTFAVRFAAVEGLALQKVSEAELFPDSAKVSGYARSPMAACQMAGILTGDNGRAQPGRALTRAEAAAILYRLYQAAGRKNEPGEETVSLEAGAYDELYKLAYTFGEPIPESGRVDPSWFKDAAFVGDSITVGLSMYHSGVLSEATFLCTTSLSAPGALAAVSAKSRHPEYNGKKMRVEDAVAACGAKNVYILLGINNMYSKVETSTDALVQLIELIQQKSPGVNIIVESVTPLTATSTILSDTMNNPKINRYNEIMRGHCGSHGWYYLDVASAVKDKNGNFNPGYCGDARRMGIHFSKAGVKVWEEYLFTHVPEALK